MIIYLINIVNISQYCQLFDSNREKNNHLIQFSSFIYIALLQNTRLNYCSQLIRKLLNFQIEIMTETSSQGWDIRRQLSSEEEIDHTSFRSKLKPIDFTEGSYPLQPDMIFGWKPKLPLGPVPLSYYNLYVDWLVTYIHSDQRYRLVYLGNRLSNSVKINQMYNYTWKMRQKYNANVKIIKQTVQKVGGSMNRRIINNNIEHQYIFDSNFESGNLDAVIEVKPNEFDLFMRSDTNTRGHCNWYYFSIKNKKTIGNIKLNICNFTKKANLYSKGMRPFIKQFNSQWKQSTQQVVFTQKYCRYGFDIKHHQLQFNYNFTKENQQVFFAYGIPYTFSKLQNFIKQIKQKFTQLITVEYLCQSLGGISIPMITITEKLSKYEKNDKQAILISGRMHPGESVSSYVIQGFIKKLLNNQNESKFLRQNFIFIIVPMINPDGVIAGNFRTSYSGKDLNRQFFNLNKLVFPQIQSLNQLAKNLKKYYNKNFEYYFDFHGHSTKSNLFCYGPQHPRWNLYFFKCRAFAKILQQTNQMFSYKKSLFTINEHKRTTGRANMFMKYKIPMTYTFEMSNGIYQNSDKKNILIKETEMIYAGQLIINGLYKFTSLNQKYYRRPKLRKHSLAKRVTRHQNYQKKFTSNKQMMNDFLIKSENELKKGKKKIDQRKSKDKKQLRKNINKYVKQSKQEQRLKYSTENALQQIFNQIRNESLQKIQEGGSDSQDQIQDLDQKDTTKLFKQIQNRQIKNVLQIQPPEKLHQIQSRQILNKQNNAPKSSTIICKTQVEQRKLIARSVTARLKKPKVENIVQQKYLLAQKSFVLNL